VREPRPAWNDVPLAERVLPSVIIAVVLAIDLIVDPPFGVAVLALVAAYVVATLVVRALRTRRVR
jgi:Flp pilus assembly protein TadB